MRMVVVRVQPAQRGEYSRIELGDATDGRAEIVHIHAGDKSVEAISFQFADEIADEARSSGKAQPPGQRNCPGEWGGNVHGRGAMTHKCTVCARSRPEIMN